jgi:hypothetical protein
LEIHSLRLQLFVGIAGVIGLLVTIPGAQHVSAQESNATISVEAAGQFADGIASVNAPLCKNPHAFGPSQTPAARAELAYLAGYKFRHVRDAFLTCFNQAEFDSAWRQLAASGARLLATELFSYTDDDLSNARKKNPGLESVTAGNEWDVANTDEVLGRDARAGEERIVTRPFGLALHMVSGQSYRFTDASSEEFTLVKPLTHDSGVLGSPLRFDHMAGTKIVRVGDFVSDVNYWLAYYAPRLRHMEPPAPVLGASLAFPIHAESFSAPDDRTNGHFGLNAIEEHGYPAPMGSNPEGPGGDGKRSYIGIDHPPCSFERTSYSLEFNRCESYRQAGTSLLPIWETEYSYQVVANGGAPLSSALHPIPDRIGILYLTRSEFFLASHGRARVYWFQMLDGTSGPSSGFCSYGLIYTGQCGEEAPVTQPRPKGELLALGNLISFFQDDRCPYPQCTWHPPAVTIRWSDGSQPLNDSVFAWKSGKIAIVAWLGTNSYDYAGTACASTSSCLLGTSARSERLSSASFVGKRVSVRTFDTNPGDPLPPQIAVKSSDGSLQFIAACPREPRRSFYGCLTPPQPVTSTGGNILLSVGDDPVIVTVDPTS